MNPLSTGLYLSRCSNFCFWIVIRIREYGILMCTNQHCHGNKPLTSLRYYKNRHVFLAAYLAVTAGLLFTCVFLWLTHPPASRSHWYSKPPSMAWEDFKVTLLVICSPVHRLGKSFFQGCFPHMKQEAALDQTSPIHNNSTLCRVKGGDFEIVHKNLQVLGNLAKSICNKAVSYQMDISLILPGLSSVFNN